MIAAPVNVLDVLRDPFSTLEFGLRQWDTLLRLLDRTRLSGHLASRLRQTDLFDQLPDPVVGRLNASLIAAEANRRAVKYEVNRLEHALEQVNCPLILLKGAAYLMAGLSPGVGRIAADVDILAPADRLPELEQALAQQGWGVAQLDPWHERYFRDWLHELPPLRHEARDMLVDVHHTILPRTDVLHIDGDDLIAASRPLPRSRFAVLAPEDMVIHSAVHLFRNGNFEHALRDLHDMHQLLQPFGAEQDFWSRLIQRINQFSLQAPCYFALHYVRMLLGTAMPLDFQAPVDAWRPSWVKRCLMEQLLRRALVPQQLDSLDSSREFAIRALAYWPVPRLRAIASPLFWKKRLRKMHPETQ